MTLCISSLWMAQCNITYIVVFNLDRKKNFGHFIYPKILMSKVCCHLNVLASEIFCRKENWTQKFSNI